MNSETTEKDDEITPEETEQSTSKQDESEEEEVTSKHTSSTDLRAEDTDPSYAPKVEPLDSRPPKKQRRDAWDLDNMLDDDDSE